MSSRVFPDPMHCTKWLSIVYEIVDFYEKNDKKLKPEMNWCAKGIYAPCYITCCTPVFCWSLIWRIFCCPFRCSRYGVCSDNECTSCSDELCLNATKPLYSSIKCDQSYFLIHNQLTDDQKIKRNEILARIVSILTIALQKSTVNKNTYDFCDAIFKSTLGVYCSPSQVLSLCNALINYNEIPPQMLFIMEYTKISKNIV